MKKILFWLCFIWISNIQAVYSQNDNISISGTIDSTILNYFKSDTLIVQVYNPFKKLTNNQEVLKIKVDSAGQFKINIQSELNIAYLSFWMAENVSDGNIVRITYPARHFYLDELYLFEKGDSVVIDFNKNGFIGFRGKGADKLNCQFNIYDMSIKSPSVSSIVTRLWNEKKYHEALMYEHENLEFAIQMKLKFINSFKSKFSNEIYQMLYLDAVGLAEYQCIYPLWLKTINPLQDVSSEARVAIGNYLLKYRIKNYINDSNRIYALKSGYFNEYLFELEWNKYKLFTDNPRQGHSFRDIYSRIKEKYNDELESYLLMICLRKLNRYFSIDIASQIDELRSDFRKTDFHPAFENWAVKFGKAYPFKLEDENGIIHKLSDYKGKVLIIDFWFTGCIPCIKLNVAMHEIMKKYVGNDDIVFLTVSQDKNKKKWIESLNTGKYTSPGTINLYTNGLGRAHPLLKFYNFKGAPHQLIIDRKGNFISSNPARPDEGIDVEYINNKFVYVNKNGMISPKMLAFTKMIDFLLH